MSSLLAGFGFGFFVAAQLGPLSLFLIRSTLRGRVAVGLAIGAGIAVIDGLYVGSLAWCSLLAVACAAARERIGPRLLTTIDFGAGGAIVGFGGLLAHRTLSD